jgi:hypothetical protein
MKYFTPLIALFFLISCASKPTSSPNEIVINSTSYSKVGTVYEMKISKISSDSRCPEGVNCVWAGEVQMEMEIYKNQKLEHSETLFINYKKLEQNKHFFAEYLSTDKKVKDIFVLPAKKQEQTIDLKDYVLKVILE